MKRPSSLLLLFLGLLLFTRLAAQPLYAAPADTVVGDGTPASCDGNALEAAVLAGGLVTFNCGGAHTIIANTMYLGSGVTTVIDGGDLITISGEDLRQLFIVDVGASLTLNNIVLSNGHWDGNGGALVVYGAAALNRSTVRDSRAEGSGGGIAVESGSLTVAHSQLLVNRAAVAGGGIAVNGGVVSVIDSTINDNEAGYGNQGIGGGIYNRGKVTILRTGFNANRAHNGAALYNEGGGSRLTVQQSTLSYNEAFYSGGAAAIHGGDVLLENTTVSGNAAHVLAGGIRIGIPLGAGSALLRNMTLYGNTVVNVDQFTSNANLHTDPEAARAQLQNTIIQGTAEGENCAIGTTPDSLGYNQATDASCRLTGTADQENANVTLAPLADNGGPTRTHLAIAGSSTVDAIPPEQCAVTIDQRTTGRPQGPQCDAGAVEGVPTTMPPLPVSQPFYLGSIYVRPIKLPIFAIQPNIAATQLEITQGIQEADGLGVTLVAGKRTYVRFHVRKTSGAADPVVGARLWRIVNGQRSGDPILPSARRGLFQFLPFLLGGSNYVFDPTVTVRSTPDRNALGDSFYFRLPSAWTTGNLSVEAEVNPTNLPNAVAESTRADNILRTSFTFADTPTMVLRLFSVVYRVNGKVYTPSETQLREVEDWLRRAYPIARLVVKRDSEDMTNLNRIPTCDEVNGRLFWDNLFLKWAGIDPVPTRYYGLVADASSAIWMRGCAADIPSFIASGPTGDPNNHGFSTWDKDNDGESFGDWYTGHELAHTWGRSHVTCRGDEGGPDMSYPMGESGSIGRQSGQNKYWGFDVMLRGPVVYPPTWKDVMTYCDNQWISAYTYEAIRAKLVSENAAARSFEAATAPLADYLVIQGTVTPDGPSATLDQVYRLTAPLVLAATAPGAYAIRLVDSGGNELSMHPFTPRVDTEAPEDTSAPQLVMEQVPFVAGTAAVQIVQGATVLDERLVSANTPVVTVVTPAGGETVDSSGLAVSWTATDADPASALVATVLYSRDGGVTFAPLRLHVSASSVVIPLEELGATSQGKVRVLVSDGINTGQGDSQGFFSVPNQPPAVQIVTPEPGEVFGYGQVIPLTGAATDLEDITVPGAAFQWHSDLDGALGSGADLDVAPATVGTHVITVQVTDANGATGASTRTLVVSDDVMLAPDALVASPPATNFVVAQGSTAAQTQPLSLRNPAENVATWVATSDAAWLSVTPASGGTPADPQVSVDPTGLATGDYVGVVTFTGGGPGGALPVATVRVSLTVVGAVDEATQRVYLPAVER